jgi:hypothetical protein
VTNPVANVTQDLSALPIQQVRDPELEGEVFQSADDPKRQFRPRFQDSHDQGKHQPEGPEGAAGTEGHVRREAGSRGQPTLVEDVAMFARTPNPNNTDRTLTICTGVFTRGVCAAVEILTDAVLCGANEVALDHLCGMTDSYGILFRVPVYGNTTSVPDLRSPGLILQSWPTK